MGKNSAIHWTDHTFNPWWGCVHVPGDPQCENCYAEKWAKRCGYKWGTHSERRMFGERHWQEPFKWNREAKSLGTRYKVFTGSMCDVFEICSHQRPMMDVARAQLWSMCEECQDLDWQMLTKRPQNVARLVPERWLKGQWPSNVWLGFSAGTQPILEHRGRIVIGLPAPIKFVSIEPMLDRLTIRNGLEGRWRVPDTDPGENFIPFDWVIIGGESGVKARPFYVPFAKELILQCFASGVAPFVKQMGSCCIVPSGGYDIGFTALGARKEIYEDPVPGVPSIRTNIRVRLAHHAGAKAEEWPEDLRVQQFPKSRAA